ncbi:MAG: hypothetical protein ACFFGZ_15820 [Candidatus Thorarchaeota archaeon]
MRFFSRKDPQRNYLNKAIIGLGVGLVRSKDLLLSPDFGPQGAMDILGVWIGQELTKELLAQKKIKPNISDQAFVEKLLEEIRLAEALHFDFGDGEITVSIQDCLICPRRVGMYDLGGDTACPVGGILMGGFTFLRGKSPSTPRIELRPAELCHVRFTVK